MRSKIQDGRAILSEQGMTAFLRRAAEYCYETVHWTVHDSYTLSLGGTTVAFSAPSRLVVQRNEKRFRSEKPELLDLLGELKPDDVVFDVGANTGLYTLFAAKRCPAGTVVAFEPYPPNMRLLERDLERNGFDNVETQELALSNERGTIEFDQPDEADVGYGSSAIGSSESGTTVEVPTTTGDALVSEEEIPTPNVVKIDVEGAEPLVVDGLIETLSAPECRLVYCEIHRSDVEYRPSIRDFGTSLSEMKADFEALGFAIEELRTDGSEVFLKAQKR